MQVKLNSASMVAIYTKTADIDSLSVDEQAESMHPSTEHLILTLFMLDALILTINNYANIHYA